MHKSIYVMVVIVLMILISSLTQAQAQGRTRSRNQPDENRQLDIYLVAGLGHIGSTNRFQTGGGIESFLYKGLSIGGEATYNTGVAGLDGLTALSPTVSYHLLNGVKVRGSLAKFDPFVTGGYSRLIGSGQDLNAANIGGGFNYWMADKWGLRVDIRDHIVSNGSLFGLRGGFVFTF